MNATSLYVSTCRLVLQANGEDSASWTDLYRLIPYLRQSLSCTVCGNLLIEPYTPTETNCQHHVCRSCKGGKKKLKPSCSWCKNYDKYVENVQLRILLQCYKKLCEYMTSTAIFKNLVVNDPCSPSANNCSLTTIGQNDGTQVLVNLIQEGSGFADDVKTIPGLSKLSYTNLPCVYTSTSTQTPLSPGTGQILTDAFSVNNSSEQNVYNNRSIRPLQNGPSLYSVMYAGNGNKLTIKRKASDLDSDQEGDIPNEIAAAQPEVPQQVPQPNTTAPTTPTQSFKKPGRGRTGAGSASNVKTGCRCGNTTATPGKLTCCGQRCPCYTDSKPCLECKCRGCRNPHTADGHKVCPVIPELQNYQLQLATTENSHITTLGNPAQCLTLTPAEITPAGTVQVVGVYTTQLHNVSPSTATTLLLDANTAVTTVVHSDEDASDVDIDI